MTLIAHHRTCSVSAPPPVLVPELTASIASSCPMSHPNDLPTRQIVEYDNVLGKRRREVSHTYSSATPTELQVLGLSPTETSISAAHLDLGTVGLTPPGICRDQGENIASPQTQDFFALFQHPINHELAFNSL